MALVLALGATIIQLREDVSRLDERVKNVERIVSVPGHLNRFSARTAPPTKEH